MDAEGGGHERAAGFDAAPGIGVALGEFAPAGFVEECDAVLDIGGEVGRAGRRNDVELDRLSRLQALAAPGIDRRVHPFVEMDEMAGIEPDVEKAVAETALDQRIDLAASDADADGLVPFGGALEVGSGKPLGIIADAGIEL